MDEIKSSDPVLGENEAMYEVKSTTPITRDGDHHTFDGSISGEGLAGEVPFRARTITYSGSEIFKVWDVSGNCQRRTEENITCPDGESRVFSRGARSAIAAFGAKILSKTPIAVEETMVPSV